MDEASILGKLSQSLQQQAETLKQLSKQKTEKKTESEAEDIFERAKSIGKRINSRKGVRSVKKKEVEDVSILLNVCEMSDTGKGNYKRSTGFVEVEVYRADKYEDVTEKIAECLEICVDDDEFLALFQLNGTQILNKDITVNNTKKPWLIGNYLSLVKKSASNLKLGIGVCSKRKRKSEKPGKSSPKIVLPFSKVSNSKTRINNCDIDVSYMKRPSSENGFKISMQYSRETIWSEILKLPSMDIDSGSPFQPEDHGFMLCSATKVPADDVILSYMIGDDCMFGGFSIAIPLTEDVDEGNFEPKILVQSPKDIVVTDVIRAVPLVCIANVHGDCLYKWDCITDKSKKFSSAPVIYVVQPGMFQCSVDFGGMAINSHCMCITVQPDYTKLLDMQHGSGPNDADDIHYHSDVFTTPMMLHDTTSSSSCRDVYNNMESIETFSKEKQANSQKSTGILKLNSEEITQATLKDEMLGRGGYGTVYVGYMRATKVAIKYLNEVHFYKFMHVIKLCSSTNHYKEGKKALSVNKKSTLVSELAALVRFRHNNLVGLMGYCEDPTCLVYEFVERGSLYDCLHTEQKFVFDWCKRSKVLKGTCRGLAWLHNNKPPLVHQDIKSSNVLINSHFEAKLGDFGFSLEAPACVKDTGKTIFTCPLVAFSQGYCAPELMEGHCSTKSDVYSYGVVVLETCTGAHAFDTKREDKQIVELMDDELKDLTLFTKAQDSKAAGGTMEPYLAQIYFKLTQCCLTKYSKRSDTNNVMSIWNETNFD